MKLTCNGCMYEGFRYTLPSCLTCKRMYVPGSYYNLIYTDNYDSYFKNKKEENDVENRNYSQM